jgi:hypothetical protein
MTVLSEPLKVFIGYDRREEEAYRVCKWSLLRHSTIPLSITALILPNLRRAGLYGRGARPGEWVDDQDGRPFSTDFSFSRFLVPALTLYQGPAVFVDCDFLFTRDIAEMVQKVDRTRPVSVVQRPVKQEAGIKMDGRVQEIYPFKNWSSLIWWECSHPENSSLLPAHVTSFSGGWLHAFSWLRDPERIGALPREWNWLEGTDDWDDLLPPAGIHFTRGGPWIPGWENVRFADLWLDAAERSKGFLT